MSSGSGNYEEDAAKEDLSDDSDLAMIKVLTGERATKQQIQIDLDRIEVREQRKKDGLDAADKAKVKGEILNVGGDDRKKREDYLQPEKVAMHAALQTGNLDLYKRAHQIN